MNKVEKIVKIVKKVTVFFSILALFNFILLINNKSYALFTKHIETGMIVHIESATELPKIKILDKVKSKLVKYEEASKDTFSGGLIAVNTDGNLYNEKEDNQEIREYRYSGPNVNNYVKLNNNNQDELWRIIGVFTDEETKEEYIRIVRNEVLPGIMFPVNFIKNGITYKIQASPDQTDAYWNSGGSNNNDWSIAGLQYYLNNEEDENGNKGYMSYLSEETKNMLADRPHYLGTFFDSNSETPVTAYQHERDVKSCVNNKGTVSDSSKFPNAGCNVWNGNAATWKGSISLMYSSDYGFSASSINWDKAFSNGTSGGFRDTAINGTSWMYNSMPYAKIKFSWLISAIYYNYYSVTGLIISGGLSTGHVNQDHINYERSVQPVLNLKSEVIVKSGVGTKNNPYVLEL